MAFFSRSNIQSGAASGLLRNHYCQTSCTNTQKVRHVYINIYIIIYIYKLGAHTHTEYMWVSIMSCPLLHIYCGHLWAGSCSNGSCTSPAPVARWNWRLPRATKLTLPEAPSELYLPKMCEESRNPKDPKVPKATCHEPNPYIYTNGE